MHFVSTVLTMIQENLFQSDSERHLKIIHLRARILPEKDIRLTIPISIISVPEKHILIYINAGIRLNSASKKIKPKAHDNRIKSKLQMAKQRQGSDMICSTGFFRNGK